MVMFTRIFTDLNTLFFNCRSFTSPIKRLKTDEPSWTAAIPCIIPHHSTNLSIRRPFPTNRFSEVVTFVDHHSYMLLARLFHLRIGICINPSPIHPSIHPPHWSTHSQRTHALPAHSWKYRLSANCLFALLSNFVGVTFFAAASDQYTDDEESFLQAHVPFYRFIVIVRMSRRVWTRALLKFILFYSSKWYLLLSLSVCKYTRTLNH